MTSRSINQQVEAKYKNKKKKKRKEKWQFYSDPHLLQLEDLIVRIAEIERD